jgi:quercetin dioxygenase-like cupin family protein
MRGKFLMKPVKIVEKPWGREIWIAHTDKYSLKIIEFKKGSRSSLQYHNLKTEHIYVDSGVLKAEEEMNGQLQTIPYSAGDVIFNPPGKKHRIEAVEDVRLIEVSTPELDDVVRVEDDYGRELAK